MRRNPKAVIAASLLTAAAITLAACSGSSGGGGGTGTGSKSNDTSPTSTTGYNAAANNVLNASSKTGGTLNLLSTGDCDSWDPGRTYYGWCFNMQRLFTRTLVGYTKVNGTKFDIGGDLATGLGTHNADFTKWTYTLRSGLKFSDGKAITPADIKYGIERLAATDVINGGPSSYFIDNIKGMKTYKGPYKGGSLSSIETTSNTITFNLANSYADFNYLMALPASAPVPANVEGGAGFKGATYTKHPVSSGPYMIKSYTQNKQITFVRNPYWSQSTDIIRKPKATSVVLTVDTNPDDLDSKLKAGTADARADNGVQPTFQSQILTQPSLKANADDPVVAATRYMAVIPSVIPNIHCRKAIFYAWDKAGSLRAFGGSTAGVIANSMTPPGIDGNDPSYDPYPSGSGSSGNIAKAKAELTACGKPNGFSTKFAYNTPSSTGPNVFKAEQSALGKVGIKITAAPQDQSNYYSTYIGSPANLKNQGIGLAVAGWGADFPTPYGFFNSITNGANILPTGNSNYASLNDPTVNRILDAAPKGKNTTADWQTLDKAILNSATYLPFIWEKTLYYRNPRMTNVTSDNALAFGIYDFVNIGVVK
ncbi:ABC transporter substrate-binding protein [uncultured Jatrophihabitans sp.]|uniref:ABC transporter substrate-binding protein n=1 Tax=uncultured Jatrophihabitans sp. TaxID=1610747 RepID=UPI0035C9E5A2